MSTLTRDEMVARVRQACSLTTAEDATILDFVEEAIDEFADLTGINAASFSFVLTANTAEYSMAAKVTGFLRFKTVRLLGVNADRAVPLMVVTDLGEWADLRAREVTAATPTKYAMLGLDTLELYPAPDAAHTLSGECVKRVTLPSSGSTVVGIPQEYQPCIVDGAVERTMRWDRQDPNEAAMFRGAFDAGVARCLRAMKRVHGSRPKAVRASSSLRGSGGPSVNLVDP